MAGGLGTRLHPLTLGINKHLLPIYNKPMIYYPLTTLMLAGIREVAIVTSPDQIQNFQTLLGDGDQFGIEIKYFEQKKPAGIADGLQVAKNFIVNQKLALILGDNIFHGSGLGRQLSNYQELTGANIFAYQVRDPQNYGVVEFDQFGNAISLEEKPLVPKSKYAVPGIYFYDELALSFVEKLNPSIRGEFEITDLNKIYLERGNLKVTILSHGIAWLDAGSIDSLHEASNYIRIVEQRQNSSIGDPLSAARVQNWI